MGVKGGLGEFCRCIKKVRRSVTPRPGSNKESAAIGICVKSVLQTRGRTLRKFSCKGTRKRGRKGKPFLQTKKLVGGGRLTIFKSLASMKEQDRLQKYRGQTPRINILPTIDESHTLLSPQRKSELIAQAALAKYGLWPRPKPHSSATETQPHSSRRSTL
jgi:hypothetical protein